MLLNASVASQIKPPMIMGQSKLKAAVTVFKKRTKLYYDHQL